MEFGRAGIEVLDRQLLGEVANALLRKHAHVDLQPEEGEHTQGEHSQNDDVAQIFHRLDHGTDDRFEAWKKKMQIVSCFLPHQIW